MYLDRQSQPPIDGLYQDQGGAAHGDSAYAYAYGSLYIRTLGPREINQVNRLSTVVRSGQAGRQPDCRLTDRPDTGHPN
jgi:hypothetical protein